jgi:hypothetical protein
MLEARCHQHAAELAGPPVRGKEFFDLHPAAAIRIVRDEARRLHEAMRPTKPAPAETVNA